MAGLRGALRRRWGRTAIVLGLVPLTVFAVGGWRTHHISTSDSAPRTFRAADGTIYTDKLFRGLQDLDRSPVPVTPEQAQAINRVLDLLEIKFRKNEYYDEQVDVVLSSEQLAFLNHNAEGLDDERMKEQFNPNALHNIQADLERVAGITVAPDERPVPAAAAAPHRPETVSRITTFIIGYAAMQRDEHLRIQADEAVRLLPYVTGYVRLKSRPQSTKHDVLAILSDDQKRWIDEHPAPGSAVGDMTVLEHDVRTQMNGRAGQ